MVWRVILRAIRALTAVAGALAAAIPAFADNAGKPMTFEWGLVYGDTPAIFADGDFTPDTPTAFRAFLRRSDYTPETRIYFNSLGGDLGGGMAVGRIIREEHLNTGVARNQPDPSKAQMPDFNVNSGVYPGYCVSACTLAFLGGVSREVEPGATYAVHQVSMNCVDRRKARTEFPWMALPTVQYCPELGEALAMFQVASGAVIEYVRSMGADPIFWTEMSKAAPDSINALTPEQLDQYRVNFEMRTESWSYETDDKGQFFLRHTQGDEWKEDRVEFYCDRTEGPRLFMWLVHDTRRSTGRADPLRIVQLADAGLTAYWQPVERREDGYPDVRNLLLQPFEIIEPPNVSDFENVTLVVDVSQRFLDVLATAERFEVATTQPDPQGVGGFNLISINLDREKLAGIVRSCK